MHVPGQRAHQAPRDDGRAEAHDGHEGVELRQVHPDEAAVPPPPPHDQLGGQLPEDDRRVSAGDRNVVHEEHEGLQVPEAHAGAGPGAVVVLLEDIADYVLLL